MSARSGCLGPCLFVFWICCERGFVAQRRELQHLILQGSVPSSKTIRGGDGEGLGNGGPQGKKIQLCGFIFIPCALDLWKEVRDHHLLFQGPH